MNRFQVLVGLALVVGAAFLGVAAAGHGAGAGGLDIGGILLLALGLAGVWVIVTKRPDAQRANKQIGDQ